MIKTIPVTAVTPLSRPPLPNAATVPSRFTPTSVDPVSVSAKTMYEPEPYSLWLVIRFPNYNYFILPILPHSLGWLFNHLPDIIVNYYTCIYFLHHRISLCNNKSNMSF